MKRNKDISIVFPRPWLSKDTDVLLGFDLGRFASALMAAENLFVHIYSLSQLSVLVQKADTTLLGDAIQSGRLRFVFYPEQGAVMGSELVTMTHPAGIREALGDSVSIARAIKHSVDEDVFLDLEISSDLAQILATGFSASPTTLPLAVARQMAIHLRDSNTRGQLSAIAREHFKTERSPLDYIEVRPSGQLTINAPDDEYRSKAGTFLLMLSTSCEELALAESVGASSIFTEDPIRKLIDLLSAPKAIMSSAHEPVDIVTKTIRLPNIGWMVNRDVLSINEVVKFWRSEKGAQFRRFLAEVTLGTTEPEKLEPKLQQAIIQSFHDKSWWEQHWSSKGAETARFTLSQAAGLVPNYGPVVGFIAGLADVFVSHSIPKAFRPTLVIAEELSPGIDPIKLKVEERRKRVLPSLAKIRKKGCEATMALRLPNGHIALLLDTPGVEEHWDMEIDPADSEGHAYLETFESMLPPHGTPARRLADALGNGADIVSIQHVYKSMPEPELTLTMTLRDSQGVTTVIEDDSQDFWEFVMGRKILSDPHVYHDFKQKRLLRK